MCPCGTMRNTMHPRNTASLLFLITNSRETSGARAWHRLSPTVTARRGNRETRSGQFDKRKSTAGHQRDKSSFLFATEVTQNQGAHVRQNILTVKRAWTRAAMFHRGIVGGKKRKADGQGRN